MPFVAASPPFAHGRVSEPWRNSPATPLCTPPTSAAGPTRGEIISWYCCGLSRSVFHRPWLCITADALVGLLRPELAEPECGARCEACAPAGEPNERGGSSAAASADGARFSFALDPPM